MTPDRSFLVVLIAAATGAVLGRSAGAVIHPPGGAVVAVPVGALPSSDHLTTKAFDAPPPSASAAGRDDGEPEEPHPDATGDNPYEESAPVAHPAPYRTQVPLRDGMLKLPGGRFVMGSASPRAPINERPVRPVVVAPFWIDRTEVTVAA
jgi:formylglycine-generating enzyme required for sulfatase activity